MPTISIPPGARVEFPRPCSCWRLRRPLAPGETLPDHVCVHAMRLSVLQSQWSASKDLASLEWPLLQDDGRLLMLVVRQQVCEAAGNPWLQPMVEQQQTWLPMVRLLRQVRDIRDRYLRVLNEYGVGTTEVKRRLKQGLDLPEDSYRTQSFETAVDVVCGDEDALGRLLQFFGFPDTSDVRALVRSAAFGGREPPSVKRGALVTTFVYGQPLEPGWLQEHLGGYPSRWTWDEERRTAKVDVDRRGVCPPWTREALFHDGISRTVREYTTPLITEPLQRSADAAERKIRDWLCRWRPSPFADRSLKAKASVLRCDDQDVNLSYLQEALDDDNVAALGRKMAQHRPWERPMLLTEYLNDCYRKVRRVRKGLRLHTDPRIVEPHWREIARRELLQELPLSSAVNKRRAAR